MLVGPIILLLGVCINNVKVASYIIYVDHIHFSV